MRLNITIEATPYDDKSIFRRRDQEETCGADVLPCMVLIPKPRDINVSKNFSIVKHVQKNFRDAARTRHCMPMPVLTRGPLTHVRVPRGMRNAGYHDTNKN